MKTTSSKMTKTMRAQIAREVEARRQNVEAAHLIRQEFQAAEQTKFRAEAAEKQGETFTENQLLIRCAYCGKIFWKKVTMGYFPEDLCSPCVELWRAGRI